ncbi:Phosphoglycolate phosphatase [Ephemeroptericola cinctiostellae]|uniref:phosphoglycolate phosphatase n=1 Tax=Ephemeroptericola cinctiostellae TaxID=2268024 RepID=A0A345D8H9_9BURK|nr:phosphoglycolate phosphatase [Ephemeroptericola cinctiostellae]AXF84667.1 Phosphoglycolate phosphatase [Ephemeroptericola cinctiostellae]
MDYHFPSKPLGVLFDLDGTLVDSAPDLAAAVNALRVRRGLPDLPLEQLRPYASLGARGLLGAGLGVVPNDPDFGRLQGEFLDYYASHNCVHSKLFDGVEGLLAWLEAHAIPWGVVTNKHMRFTDSLVRALGLSSRAAVVVSGDTTAQAKPHPLPLLYAAEQMGLPADRLVYVGDDLRDIQSARAAGYMTAIAAAYGYCEDEEVSTWLSDCIVRSPVELLHLFKLAWDA